MECNKCNKESKVCSCKSKSYTSSIKYDGEKLVCNKDGENKFTIRSCSKLNDVISTFAENICELWNSAISVDYISNVQLEGTILNFTGVGNAFNGPIDLSVLGGGGDSLYNSDNIFTGGAVLNERTVDMANYKIGWINNSQWGIGVAANAVGVSTEVGGINDTTAQFHVAGAIRTDNWYHGRYGLLLHQFGASSFPSTNLFCGTNTGVASNGGGGTLARNTGFGTDVFVSLDFNSQGNTAVGYGSLKDLTTGVFNTSVGSFSSYILTTSSFVTSLGHGAARRNTSASVTAVGFNAGDYGGSKSSFLGESAGAYCPAAQSVVIGAGSVRGNPALNGVYDLPSLNNTIIGNNIRPASTADATYRNSDNVLIGYGVASLLSTGLIEELVAVGTGALQSCTSLSVLHRSTYVGFDSGKFLQGGIGYNTFLGWQTGWSLNQAERCVLIGSGVGFDNFNTPKNYNWSNVIGIGSPINDATNDNTLRKFCINIGNYTINSSNTIKIGNVGEHITAEIPVAWTITSDERFKNIDNNGNIPGLDFVMQLNPIRYKLKDIETGLNREEKSRYGFSAQQVISIEGNDIVIGDNSDLEHLKLRESMIIPVLVKAIKELKQEINTLKLNNNLQ